MNYELTQTSLKPFSRCVMHCTMLHITLSGSLMSYLAAANHLNQSAIAGNCWQQSVTLHLPTSNKHHLQQEQSLSLRINYYINTASVLPAQLQAQVMSQTTVSKYAQNNSNILTAPFKCSATFYQFQWSYSCRPSIKTPSGVHHTYFATVFNYTLLLLTPWFCRWPVLPHSFSCFNALHTYHSLLFNQFQSCLNG